MSQQDKQSDVARLYSLSQRSNSYALQPQNGVSIVQESQLYPEKTQLPRVVL
jgi:hypothetical protein